MGGGGSHISKDTGGTLHALVRDFVRYKDGLIFSTGKKHHAAVEKQLYSVVFFVSNMAGSMLQGKPCRKSGRDDSSCWYSASRGIANTSMGGIVTEGGREDLY